MSINEISKSTGKSKSIVSRYIQGIKVLPEFKETLRIKQGGSKVRAKIQWSIKLDEARKLIKELNKEHKLLILAAIYWGEGTKKELNIINSDPSMLRVALHCLREIGIKDSDFRASIRVYDDIDRKKALNFWSQSLNIPIENFVNFDIRHGKKKGKLEFGMCRIRVKKSATHFKLIMSLIERIKELLP